MDGISGESVLFNLEYGLSENHLPGLYHEIHAERVRAHKKHGHHGFDAPATGMEVIGYDARQRLPVLVEEVGEVAKAICDGDPVEHIREELIQVAAMAAAWIAACDRAIEEERLKPVTQREVFGCVGDWCQWHGNPEHLMSKLAAERVTDSLKHG